VKLSGPFRVAWLPPFAGISWVAEPPSTVYNPGVYPACSGFRFSAVARHFRKTRSGTFLSRKPYLLMCDLSLRVLWGYRVFNDAREASDKTPAVHGYGSCDRNA
jgi:hypothetical protein